MNPFAVQAEKSPLFFLDFLFVEEKALLQNQELPYAQHWSLLKDHLATDNLHLNKKIRFP